MFFTIGYKAIWLGFVAIRCGRPARCGARPPASRHRSSRCPCWRWCRGAMRGGPTSGGRGGQAGGEHRRGRRLTNARAGRERQYRTRNPSCMAWWARAPPYESAWRRFQGQHDGARVRNIRGRRPVAIGGRTHASQSHDFAAAGLPVRDERMRARRTCLASRARRLGTVTFATSCAATRAAALRARASRCCTRSPIRAAEELSRRRRRRSRLRDRALGRRDVALSPSSGTRPAQPTSRRGRPSSRKRATRSGASHARERAFIDAAGGLLSRLRPCPHARARRPTKQAMADVAARYPGRHGGAGLLRARAARAPRRRPIARMRTRSARPTSSSRSIAPSAASGPRALPDPRLRQRRARAARARRRTRVREDRAVGAARAAHAVAHLHAARLLGRLDRVEPRRARGRARRRATSAKSCTRWTT